MKLVAGTIVPAVALAWGLGAQDLPLQPTAHPPLPSSTADYWFVPGATAAADSPAARLARAAGLIEDGDHAVALTLVPPGSLAGSLLGDYADYYAGVALAGTSRLPDADAILTRLVERRPGGALEESAILALADVAVAQGSLARAEDLLEELSEEKTLAPADVLLRLAKVEDGLTHRDHAVAAYSRVYFDMPLSEQAAEAGERLASLDPQPLSARDRFSRELRRAEALLAARRWADARAAFEPLAKIAEGDDRELVVLRLAEAEYYLGRPRAARTALTPYLKGARRDAEVRFFHLSATRSLGDHAAYVRLARALVDDHPDSEWAADTLNNLASHYITIDEDPKADPVFRELLRRFPRHRYAERAAWKTGWAAYRAGKFAETAEIFERAAATFPRADNRPAWLYWSARSRDQLRDTAAANNLYRLVIADYQNLYYGRLAAGILGSRRERLLPSGPRPTAPAPDASAPPTADRIRALAGAGLYAAALGEVQHAQLVHGDSPQLMATSAWLRHQQGLTLQSMDRFTALRGAITTMRRAYPQFMAAGGEALPPELLKVIYPLDFWPLITKYADAHALDPYLLAALVVQESTLTPDVRSAANAYGLMQLIPDTGRQVARQLGIRRFTTSMLTQPETNVRLGTKYFKDMVERFGGVHYALAGYNAGPHRVVAWLKEAPGLPRDEFIDNIPFVETQGYVKRILGTAEDYRRLYGSGVLEPGLGAD